MTTLAVPRRFNGPPRSGNGGWVAGALASTLPDQAIGQSVTVTLRQPPPLETPMQVSVTAAGATLSHDGRPVADAVYADLDPSPVAPVSVGVAAVAEAAFRGHGKHPFARCFVCGTDRRPGDGLRIFAGPLPDEARSSPDDGRVASTWSPYETGVALTWAALDCPGGWSSDLEGRPAVLGRITTQVRRLPRTSERYVIVGEERRIEGRKTFTAATLYGEGGDVVASAEHVWIAIDPEEFR
ncbi:MULTISPECIES: hypothetical protein [unclassified Nocardioides]|uniref:hypothetical protein n=1 Tax=unclassified Nocardioides TaxID=2615069 RepID=UPI0006FCA393|nr:MULTISPECIES: hypothetical protein [unclassified Nocardioides]KRA30924.1 hypothetical protein ASD81_15595 [Nocardioides sp. Root614]KRA87545.1 hypothetical protein ASD84_15870 [Nocardioides sp. Root682]